MTEEDHITSVVSDEVRHMSRAVTESLVGSGESFGS
jgi:hypothetical protein